MTPPENAASGSVIERTDTPREAIQSPALQQVPVGATGLEIVPLILGGAEFGWNVDLKDSHRIIDTFAERGGNALHTADTFGAGRSEHIIGQWLQTRTARDEMVLAVKIGGHPDSPGMGPVDLIRSVEASLNRLGADHIDIVYLDAAADTVTALEDTLATSAWLVESGKIRNLGVVGFDAAQLVEARILASSGYPLINVLDIPFNLLEQDDLDNDLRLVATAQQIAVTPSHPLAHGFLSGSHRSREYNRFSAREKQLAANVNRRGNRVLRALDAVSEELETTNAAVAVAWLLGQDAVCAPIVNAFASEHVEELMQGLTLPLGRGHAADIARSAS